MRAGTVGAAFRTILPASTMVHAAATGGSLAMAAGAGLVIRDDGGDPRRAEIEARGEEQKDR